MLRLHHAGPALYTYDGTKGHYEVAACPIKRARRPARGSGVGWEVYLPDVTETTIVRTLGDARKLIAYHDG